MNGRSGTSALLQGIREPRTSCPFHLPQTRDSRPPVVRRRRLENPTKASLTRPFVCSCIRDHLVRFLGDSDL
jgi:hypothetical protein